ncbi:MAG: YqcI/YcgG family protein [Rhodoferax sp.]|nr:YqcI/YcgG family protein [Rhodoferax sp.]
MSHIYAPVAPAHRNQMANRFTAYMQNPTFPCVGARSAFNKGRVRFGHYGVLGDANAPELCADLLAFSREFAEPGLTPVTFIAMFNCAFDREGQFSQGMWAQLRAVHAYDQLKFEWDATVSSDPASPDFSFSVSGRAFFVVGLSPAASRLSRRAPKPCDRDIALRGSINPNLAGFGEKSEARQYSGMAHSAEWKCPFRPGESGAGDAV